MVTVTRNYFTAYVKSFSILTNETSFYMRRSNKYALKVLKMFFLIFFLI